MLGPGPYPFQKNQIIPPPLAKSPAIIEFWCPSGSEAALKKDGHDFQGRWVSITKYDGEIRKRKAEPSTTCGEDKRRTVDPESNCKVYVRGLPWRATEEDIRDYFALCGGIMGVEMPLMDDGRSSGTGEYGVRNKSEG